LQFGEDISLQTKLQIQNNVKEQQNKPSAKNYMPKEKFGNHIAWMHYVGVFDVNENKDVNVSYAQITQMYYLLK
jgi:hypothetical protein